MVFVNSLDGGVPPANSGGYVPHNAPTCPPLYYPLDDCSVQIKNAWLNAIISEIACAIDSAGLTYDCGSVCNLSSAIMGTGTITGWCGGSRAEAEASKGSALAHGDYWMNSATGTAYYVDASLNDIKIEIEVFLCCSSGRIYARCGGGLKHLPGSGAAAAFRLEGICATSQTDAESKGLAAGGVWIDVDDAPITVYAFDGSTSVQVYPQPDFFSCCDENRIYVRCGGSYINPAECGTPLTGQYAGTISKSIMSPPYNMGVGETSVSWLVTPGPDVPNARLIALVYACAVDSNAAAPAISAITAAGIQMTQVADIAVAATGGGHPYGGGARSAIYQIDRPAGNGPITIEVALDAESYLSVAAMQVVTANPNPVLSETYEFPVSGGANQKSYTISGHEGGVWAMVGGSVISSWDTWQEHCDFFSNFNGGINGTTCFAYGGCNSGFVSSPSLELSFSKRRGDGWHVGQCFAAWEVT